MKNRTGSLHLSFLMESSRAVAISLEEQVSQVEYDKVAEGKNEVEAEIKEKQEGVKEEEEKEEAVT